MVFDEKAWEEQLSKARTNEEFHAVIQALPDPPETAEEDPVSIFMAQRKNSRSSTSTTPNEKTKNS